MDNPERHAGLRGHVDPLDRTECVSLGREILRRESVGRRRLVDPGIGSPVIHGIDTTDASGELWMGDCPRTGPEATAAAAQERRLCGVAAADHLGVERLHRRHARGAAIRLAGVDARDCHACRREPLVHPLLRLVGIRGQRGAVEDPGLRPVRHRISGRREHEGSLPFDRKHLAGHDECLRRLRGDERRGPEGGEQQGRNQWMTHRKAPGQVGDGAGRPPVTSSFGRFMRQRGEPLEQRRGRTAVDGVLGEAAGCGLVEGPAGRPEDGRRVEHHHVAAWPVAAAEDIADRRRALLWARHLQIGQRPRRRRDHSEVFRRPSRVRCGGRKSLFCAIRLAEWELLKKVKGFSPILLMDDIFEKLDEARMAHLLGWVATATDGPVFITDTHKARVADLLGRYVENYQLIEL